MSPSSTVKILALLMLMVVSAMGTDEAGLKFLEENKSKPGVVTLPSGLQYKVLTEGDGAFHPAVGTSCSCHYEGKLTDGTTFDSSYDRGSPTTFAPNQVIKGWTEAMQLMVEGDKWEMYIPSDLAYGEGGSPPKIPGGSALVFTMEIIKINGDKVEASKCDPMSAEKTGCDEMSVKYIEKLNAKASPEKLTELMAKINEADAPEVGKKGLKVMKAFIKKELGIKLKNGKLSSKWYGKLKKIISKMTAAKKEEL